MDYDAELQLHNELLRRVCDIQPGEHVLDIGCGSGLTTREAARSATMGRALGVDTSAAMLALARELAREENLHNVTFEEGDAQTHRLASGSFSLAMSRYGTMFFRNPVTAFRNIGTALMPGGRLVMMVWQNHAANEWSTSVQRCLSPDQREPIASVEGLDPFSLSDRSQVELILAEAGFSQANFIEVTEPVYYGEGIDAAMAWVCKFVFVREALQRLDESSRERVLERLRDVFAEHEGKSGVWFDARAWIVTARRT